MGDEAAALALASFDGLYRQDNGESPLQQLQVQLANALPFDLEDTELAEYKNLTPRWHDWSAGESGLRTGRDRGLRSRLRVVGCES